MIRIVFQTACLAALPLVAGAHEGHGAPGTHWHGTDAWGFLIAGALIAATLWSRRGK